ncbi:MAG: cupredoxin domain-containing protein [Chloroflexi bacterium]|nr:cupredoxin domain-containing protein [Chloroflexota bacterium]
MRILHVIWALSLALVVACTPAVPPSPTPAPPKAAPTAAPAVQPSPTVAPAAPTAAPKPTTAPQPTAAPKPAAPSPTAPTKPAGQQSLTIQVEPPMGPVPSEFPAKITLTALNPKGLPIGHVDFDVSVKDAAGNAVFGGASLHEHLGQHEFWVGPLKPGKYTVDAAVQATMDTPKDDAFQGSVKNSFALEAKPGGFTEKVDVSLSIGASPRAGEPTKITFALKNPADGKPVVHSDNYLQIYRAGVLVYQSTNLHSHMGTQAFDYTFADPGEYQLTVSSFPTPMRASVPFKPVIKSLTARVAAGSAAAARPAAAGQMAAPVMPEPGKPAAVIMVEPPMGPVPTEFPTKVVVKALNARLQPIGHVDFTVRVTALTGDAAGNVVFSGSSLHEHLGVHQFWVGPLKPGSYTVDARAEATMDTPKEDAEAIKSGLTAGFQFEARAGGFAEKAELGLSVGPDPRAGKLTRIEFGLKNPADGKPVVHTDNYLNIYKDGLLVYQATNLHSHMGNQVIDYTFAEPGEYQLALSSFPTPMRASVPFQPLGKSLTVKVGSGAASGSTGQTGTTTAKPAAPAAAAGGTARLAGDGSLTVTAKEMEFNVTTIEVARGAKVAITFQNAGRIPHNLTIAGLNLATATIEGGQQAKLEFTADRPGEYEFFCSVTGHKEAGMVGKLIVR